MVVVVVLEEAGGVGGGQLELELDEAEGGGGEGVVLDAVELVGDVGAADVDFEGGLAHLVVGVVEEGVEHVEDGGLGEDELLQAVVADAVAVHVDGREEHGLHLVVALLVGRLLEGDEDLAGSQRHLAICDTFRLVSIEKLSARIV